MRTWAWKYNTPSGNQKNPEKKSTDLTTSVLRYCLRGHYEAFQRPSKLLSIIKINLQKRSKFFESQTAVVHVYYLSNKRKIWLEGWWIVSITVMFFAWARPFKVWNTAEHLEEELSFKGFKIGQDLTIIVNLNPVTGSRFGVSHFKTFCVKAISSNEKQTQS